jgi:tritrans,polycis-undecaprenyl-diphosphate synthase [geranylgeranyl-diphosphate specific]
MPEIKKLTPKHIGIILDGNRRWAREKGLPEWKGHESGYQKVRKLFHWCREMGINEVTVYCFSMQNLRRSKNEVRYLMRIFERGFKEIIREVDIHKNKVKISVIGQFHLLPDRVRKAIKRAVEITKKYGNFKINFAIAYGGREEIIEVVKKIARKVKRKLLKLKDINEELVNQHMFLSSTPDLIIRTGGEIRTSNFLLWQSNYSEWFFIKKYWPDFEKKDLEKVINEYKKRQRRFGR